MSETLILATPETPLPPRTGWQVAAIELRRLPFWSVVLTVVDSNGQGKVITRTGLAAATLVKAFNRRNFSAQSIERQALEWARDQGEPGAGVMTGMVET